MGLEVYGSVKLRGSLDDGTGDPLITKDASTNALGTAANALGTLASARIFVGNVSSVPTGVDVTGDVTISNAGVTAIAAGVIVNADVKSDAAIAVSKLAAITASRAVVSDASGFLSASAVTSTELGYVSGVTSAIQTQINTKQATITGGATTIASSDLTVNRALVSNASGKVAVSAVTSTELGYVSGVTSAIQTQLGTKLTATISSVAEGDIIYYNGTNWVNLARGTNGQALYSTATSIQWNTPTINGIPVGGTANQVLAKQSGTDFDADWETLVTASITDITATAAELNVLDGITATVTELNYTDGVSSNIQVQLDSKQSSTLPQNSIWIGNSSNVATALSAGTNGYVLTSVSGVPTWAVVSAGTPPGSDTQVIFNDAGSFAGDAGMTYNKTTNALSVNLTPPAGTATANTAPIKLATGTALTTPEDGAIEYHSAHLYFTIGSTRYQLDQQGGGSISGLTANRIPYASSATSLADDTSFTWDATNNAMTIGTARIHTAGTNSWFAGTNSGNFTNTGARNIGIGEEALNDVTTGTDNVTIGNTAGDLITDGASNIAIGSSALGAAISGVGNVAVGHNALLLATGNYNVGIGFQVGNAITTGAANVAIGYDVDVQSASSHYQLTIQNAIFGLNNSSAGTTVSTGTLGVYVAAPTASLDIAAGTTAKASLRIRKGVAPTSPNDGDIWYDDAAETLHVRINGVTKTFTLA